MLTVVFVCLCFDSMQARPIVVPRQLRLTSSCTNRETVHTARSDGQHSPPVCSLAETLISQGHSPLIRALYSILFRPSRVEILYRCRCPVCDNTLLADLELSYYPAQHCILSLRTDNRRYDTEKVQIQIPVSSRFYNRNISSIFQS